jgi:uncharacterized repeat protein (TIGR02543 family)
MQGGLISANTASGNGAGVNFGSGTFNMSGSAIVAQNNAVYLASGKQITLSGALNPEANAVSPGQYSAKITPQVTAVGTEVIISSATPPYTAVEADIAKFTISTAGRGIDYDSAALSGKLAILNYTVTFNSNGGSAVASQIVAYGATVAYPAEPTKEGQFFDGWYADAACTTAYIYGAPVTGDITLYAKWLVSSTMINEELGYSHTTIEVSHNNSTAVGDSFYDNSWLKAKTLISTAGNYIIKVTGSFDLDGIAVQTFTPTGIKVLIYSDETNTISLSTVNGNLLRIEASQTVILRNITLVGKTTNDASLVYCSGSGSKLFMRPGAVVKDNVNSGTGGGMIVGSGGTFTMSGGAINSNTASTGGGGVYVNGGTFNMNSGTISDNESSLTSGGGVFVTSGIFTMNGGTISGNKAIYSGGGVFVFGGVLTMNGGPLRGKDCSSIVYRGGCGVQTAGTFNMSGGIIYGNECSSSGVGGGGVNNSGTFNMSGGIVYGNEPANGTLKNTASTGAALQGTVSWGSGVTGVVGGVPNGSTGGTSTTTDLTLSTQ